MGRTSQTARIKTSVRPRKSHGPNVPKDNSAPVLFEEMSLDQLKEKQKELGIKDSDIKGSGKNGGILKSDRIKALEEADNSDQSDTVQSESDITSKSEVLDKKPKAPKKEHSHPPYKVMIGKAILAERNRNGSTRQYLKKYLETNYKIDPKSHYLKKEITKLTSLTTGARLIVDPKHTGHYRLSEEYKNEILGKKTKTNCSAKKGQPQLKCYLFYLDSGESDDENKDETPRLRGVSSNIHIAVPMYYGSIIEAKDEKDALKIAKKELKDENFTKEDWDLLRVKEFTMIKRK